jgi:hypothetical protein
MGQNSYTGDPYALNPKQYASPQGTQFALQQLQRVLGLSPTPYAVAPTAGPYSTPGAMEVLPETTALDGTPLGGMNLGAVANIYESYPSGVADQVLRDSTPARVLAASPQQQVSTPQVASSQVSNTAASAGAPNGSSTSPSGLPLSFSADLLGRALPGNTSSIPNPVAPKGSAFVPSSGQSQNMGIAQLNRIMQWLASQGVRL